MGGEQLLWGEEVHWIGREINKNAKSRGTWKNCFKAGDQNAAALSRRSDAHFLSPTIYKCLFSSLFSFISPFISLVPFWVPPSFYSYPLPPLSQFEIPSCYKLITIYFPLRAITLRGLIFFSSIHILELLKPDACPCLEALTTHNMGCMIVS